MGIPTGNHKIILTLNATLEEFAGQLISSISFIVALFLGLWFCKFDHNNFTDIVR